MTLLQQDNIEPDVDQAPAALGNSNVVIRFAGVRKTYRLYGSMQAMAMERMGAPRWLMGRSAAHIHDFHALDGVNLEIRRGERLGIVGRNGAGKTTLLKMILGNFEPTAGKVDVNGKVQALLQTGYGFNVDMTGRENIRSSLLYNGLHGGELDHAVADVIDFVELGQFIDQPVVTYSQGMLARLQFAAATALRPDILLIDEVMNAGDAYFNAKCSERMNRLTLSGCTLLLASHATQQVIQYCDRAIWLKDGKVFKRGDVTDVVAGYEVYIQRLLSKAVPDPAEMSQAAKLAAWEPEELTSDLQVTLSDGRVVHRWPGRPGVQIEQFSIVPGGRDSGEIETGENLEIEFEISISSTADYGCIYYVGFWTADGRRACRVESPIDYFHAKAGDRRRMRVALKPFMLGANDYKVTFSIYDRLNFTSTVSGSDSRFDVLMRCYTLKVRDRHAEVRAMSYPPAVWEVDGNKLDGDTRSDSLASS